jgi:precorrin-6B methylase 2
MLKIKMKEETDFQFVGEKLAPYNPTNADAISIAINLLKIQPDDFIFDLGCGDARFLVQVIVFCCS